jgi:PAS domain S-box-containing protein
VDSSRKSGCSTQFTFESLPTFTYLLLGNRIDRLMKRTPASLDSAAAEHDNQTRPATREEIEREMAEAASPTLEVATQLQELAVERQRLQAALRTWERKYQSLFEHASDLIFIVEPAGLRLLDANKNAVRQLGFEREELLQLTLHDLTAADDHSRNSSIVVEMLRSGSTLFEQVYRSKDGTEFPVEVSSRIVDFGDGQVYQIFVRDITERKRAEAQLRLQSSALEAAANAIVITDRDGNIIWVNSAFTPLTGFSADEAVGQKPSLIKSGEQESSYYEELWQTILAGKVWQGQLINQRKDKQLYIDEQTITPIRDELGQISHFVAIKQDITKRVNSEMELRRLKELNEGIVQSVTEAITIQDEGGRFTFVNPAASRLLGYDTQELIGQHWMSIVPADQRPLAEAADRRRKQGEANRYELRIVGKDGTRIPVLVSGSPWYQEGIIAGSISVFTDLSERVQRERERSLIVEVAAALRTARNRSEMFPIILDQLLALLEAQGAALFLLLPGDEGNLIALGRGTWEAATGERFPAGVGVVGRVIATGEIYLNDDVTGEGLIYRPDLVVDTTAIACVPLITQEQTIGALWMGRQKPFMPKEVSVLSAIGDMAANAIQRATFHEQTLRHAAELEQRVADRTWELAQANEQLKELDRLKSKFVSDVSHELRTPMTNLNLYLDLLTKGRPEQYARYAAVLKREVGRLGRLVEDILDLSRLEMGKGKALKFEQVNLNEVIELVVTAHRPQAEAAGLHLSFVPGVDLPFVYGQRNQLAQVVTNLVGNAIVYTGQGHIGICTFYDDEQDMVCMQVQDSGAGINDEDLPHLFERFYRGQSSGQSNIPGTGLGLAIVKEIVDLHEGNIRVDSEPGKGTLFTVHLLPANEMLASSEDVA